MQSQSPSQDHLFWFQRICLASKAPKETARPSRLWESLSLEISRSHQNANVPSLPTQPVNVTLWIWASHRVAVMIFLTEHKKAWPGWRLTLNTNMVCLNCWPLVPLLWPPHSVAWPNLTTSALCLRLGPVEPFTYVYHCESLCWWPTGKTVQPLHLPRPFVPGPMSGIEEMPSPLIVLALASRHLISTCNSCNKLNTRLVVWSLSTGPTAASSGCAGHCRGLFLFLDCWYTRQCSGDLKAQMVPKAIARYEFPQVHKFKVWSGCPWVSSRSAMLCDWCW